MNERKQLRSGPELRAIIAALRIPLAQDEQPRVGQDFEDIRDERRVLCSWYLDQRVVFGTAEKINEHAFGRAPECCVFGF